METYTRMGIKEPWATLNMSERTHSLFYIVTLAGTVCFEYRYTQNEINSNMYPYKLLFIVVLMLRNPKTVKKLQYGKNKVTFIPEPKKVLFIKVVLFLQFEPFLSEKSAGNHLNWLSSN